MYFAKNRRTTLFSPLLQGYIFISLTINCFDCGVHKGIIIKGCVVDARWNSPVVMRKRSKLRVDESELRHTNGGWCKQSNETPVVHVF